MSNIAKSAINREIFLIAELTSIRGELLMLSLLLSEMENISEDTKSVLLNMIKRNEERFEKLEKRLEGLTDAEKKL